MKDSNGFDPVNLRLAVGSLDAETLFYLVTTPGEPHPIAEINKNVYCPDVVANRIADCVNAAAGLDLPADVKPGAIAELAAAAEALTGRYAKHGTGIAYEADRLEAALAGLTVVKDGAPVSSGEWDNTQANAEGWVLYFEEDNRFVRVTTIETLAKGFASDGHAIAFVRDRAAAGSAYHAEALRLAGLA